MVTTPFEMDSGRDRLVRCTKNRKDPNNSFPILFMVFSVLDRIRDLRSDSFICSGGS